MERKKVEQMMQAIIARPGELDSTTYIPAIKVNIIATTETMLRPVDAASNLDTCLGLSYNDETKQINREVIDSARADASDTINIWKAFFFERSTSPSSDSPL